MKRILVFLLFLLIPNSNYGFLKYFGAATENAKIRFTTGIEDKKEKLVRLIKEQEGLKESEKEFKDANQGKLDTVNTQISEVKEQSKTAKDVEETFLTRELSILNETYQTIFNQQFVRKQLGSIIAQHINLLEDYISDPHFKALTLEPRSFYSYDDLQRLGNKVLFVDDKVSHLGEQKNEAIVDLGNRKRKLSSISKEYEEKKKEQEAFSPKVAEGEFQESEEGFSFKQQGELLDLEEKFLSNAKELTQLKVTEAEHKIAFINTHITVENEKLKLLKMNFGKVKSSLRIEDEDLKRAKEELSKVKQETLATNDSYLQSIRNLTTEKEKYIKELNALYDQYNIPATDVRDFSEWGTIPQTMAIYIALCGIGYKNAQLNLVESKIDLLRAQIYFEQVKLHHKQLVVDIMKSWYKITQRQFKTNDEIIQELNHFRDLLTEATRDEGSVKDKQNTVTNKLKIQNKALNNLKNVKQEIEKQKNVLFKDKSRQFNECTKKLELSERFANEQINNIGKLIEIYSNLIATLDGTKKDLNSIVAELETKSMWQRSEGAISWQGIKNIIPDLQYFINDIYYLGFSFFSSLTTQFIIQKLKPIFTDPLGLLFLLIKLFIWLLGLFFFKNRLPSFSRFFLTMEVKKRALYITNRIIAALLQFIERHFVGLYIWATLFFFIYFESVIDLFPRILFYLASIFYLLYVVRSFIQFFIIFNKEHEYIIFSSSFEKRFSFAFSLFGYLGIIILFFREAFILATYHTSELPDILLASYSIFVRTLIIFSIGKDEILSFIPEKGAIWIWLSNLVDKYYYPLMVFIIIIMVMSDPYVGGYGNLVSYFVWGLIGSIILLKVLQIIQIYAKKGITTFFFYEDDGVVRERFSYSKTGYGFVVILLYAFVVLLALYIGAHIWHMPFMFEDIVGLFNYELFTTTEGIETHKITLQTISRVIAIIITGFVFAYGINKYVLRRIFELLPVELGIQNTIYSITRYFIIAIAIFVAFQWAKLGSLLLYIGFLIGSIVFWAREPILDLISYFIILVQRPIKIGDYIKIDDQISGVVRHITPRSVILRAKNSYTIIVPNATIITRAVNNWNYTRGYVAFDDITFIIPYSQNPEKVRGVVKGVLEENTSILKTPNPIIRLRAFAENGYEFMVRAFISSHNTLEKWDMESELRFAIVAALKEHDIKIAVPTRVIITEQTSRI